MPSSSSSKNSTVVRSEATLAVARAMLHAAFALSGDLGGAFAEKLFTTPRRYARPEREQRVLASARPFDVEVSLRAPRWGGKRTRVAAWRWGYGPTVMLVHGWEGRGSQLGALVQPLVDAGLGVVAFDAPGHGDSPGSRLYLTDLADTIADVARATGSLHAIIAHSFGTAATLLAHARHGITARRTVAIAPNVIIEDAVAHFATIAELEAPQRAMLEGHLAASNGVAMDGLALDTLVGRRRDDLLVVHDTGDREVLIVQGERLAAAWPQAELLATTGLGHRRVLRDPAVIERVVAFAAGHVPVPTSDLVREVDRAMADA